MLVLCWPNALGPGLKSGLWPQGHCTEENQGFICNWLSIGCSFSARDVGFGSLFHSLLGLIKPRLV